MEPKTQFGINLRAIRTELGLTQEQLSFEAHMDMAEISRLERGTRDPGLGTLVRLADALNRPLQDLLVGIRDPVPDP